MSNISIIKEPITQDIINQCIFCLGGSQDGIMFQNKACRCKYNYHSDCIKNYIKLSSDGRQSKCPICKKKIDITKNNILDYKQLSHQSCCICFIRENNDYSGEVTGCCGCGIRSCCYCKVFSESEGYNDYCPVYCCNNICLVCLRCGI